MFLNLNSRGDKIAAIDDTNTAISYSDLLTFGSELFSHIKKRTLIFILSENAVGSLAGYVASLTNRIVPLLLSSSTEKKLLEKLIEVYRPAYLWMPERDSINFDHEVIYKGYNYVLLKTGWDSFDLHNDLSLLLSTSGSTGSPKLVRHSYDNIEHNAKNVSEALEINERERPMAVLPIHYTMGLSVITSHLFVGATILLTKMSLTDPLFWKRLKYEEASSLTGVPYSFEVLNKLRFFKMNLPHLKVISQGGGKMSDELFQTCAEYATLNNKKFFATYGQTEGTARMAYLPSELAMVKTGSIGRAIPNGKLLLVDQHKQEITKLEGTGEMVYKGPNVTLGYAFKGTDLAKGDENKGVLFTGDIAKRDIDGCYYIIGRSGRFIKLFGLRIGLDEVEHLIKSEFELDCVCTGTDDKMIVYITKEDFKEDIKRFIISKTGLFHQSFEVIYKERILRSESGKVIY